MDELLQRKANILIVDDDILIAECTKFYLKKTNYTVIGTAIDAQEAVTLAKATTPDLILMDINLGGPIDGITVAGEIKNFAEVKIIFLTAYSDQTTMDRAKKVGFSDYLIKPIKYNHMIIAIEKALGTN